jgi:hypothetical protein
MPDDPSRTLRKQQADLGGALQGRVQIPPEFDKTKVAAAAQSLLRKRGGEIKLAWPELAKHLGKRFSNLFATFVATRNPPQPNPVIDGYEFTVWLSSRERLPAEVILAVRRYESQRTGRPRVWWQPDRRKVMIVWRWRGRARSATFG